MVSIPRNHNVLGGNLFAYLMFSLGVSTIAKGRESKWADAAAGRLFLTGSTSQTRQPVPDPFRDPERIRLSPRVSVFRTQLA